LSFGAGDFAFRGPLFPATGIVGCICIAAGAFSRGCCLIGPVLLSNGRVVDMADNAQRSLLFETRPAFVG
jgi:hypothetical protein